MRQVPRKNIFGHFADVKPPRNKAAADARRFPTPEMPMQADKVARFLREEGTEIRQRERISRWKKVALSALIAVMVIGAAGIVAVWQWGQSRLIALADEALRTFDYTAGSLKELNFEGAGDHLSSLQSEVDAANSVFERLAGYKITDALGRFVPIVQDVGRAWQSFSSVTSLTVRLADEASHLERHAFTMIATGRGEELLASLRTVQELVSGLKGEADQFSQAFMAQDGEDTSMPLRFELGKVERVVDGLVAWIGSTEEKKVAVFFGNSAELRPGGGFLGSFAEVTMKNANITDITVRDINEIDREFERKITPPTPLQGIVRRWRSADANWFFDFPTSAEKTLFMMEMSEFYKSRGVGFSAAISLTPAVVADILSVTGPIERDGKKIDGDTFLYMIQSEVQQGLASGDADPKSILKELVPAILERLKAIDDDKKRELSERMRVWVENRDVLVYMRDQTLQSFFAEAGFSGSEYRLGTDFNGTYLAVVKSNIGGAKTDIVMNDKVLLQSQVNNDGTINNHLVITRAHEGSRRKEWWYREPNQSYMQIITPVGSVLDNIQGVWDHEVSPRVQYEKEGYGQDEDLKEWESAMRPHQSFPAVSVGDYKDKHLVAFWSRTALGAKSESVIDYQHRLFLPPEQGRQYEFIIERQPGAGGSYKIEIASPIGFFWKENGLPVFEYEAQELPGRVELLLTLQKI